MEFKDYYDIMGVPREATQDEIKRAYRKLARKFHPDVSAETDADLRFKELGEAYEVLKDPEKRAAYDQLGADWQQGQEFRPPPNWDAGFEYSGGFDNTGGAHFSDFFESIFGQRATSHGSGSTYQARGEDHHARILIDIEDAFEGAERAITLQAPVADEQGHVSTRARTLNVRIPAGVKAGQQIRLVGQGSPGFGGGASGDLYLEIEFRKHAYYSAEGADLYLDLPLSPWEAALGAKVRVPTPAGSVELNIPAGASVGKKMRLQGRGLPGKPAGDLFAVVKIVIPPADSEDAKTLYRKMEQELAFNPRAAMEV